MFKFDLSGEILGVQQGKDAVYLRLKAGPTDFRFSREGEVAAPMQIIARGIVAESARGLSIGTRVSITGIGAVGSHIWEKREFGKVKSKDITNYYLQADKITIQK